MSTTVKTGWLKDNNGEKFAPKTLVSQIISSDGTSLESKINLEIDTIEENLDKHVNDFNHHVESQDKINWNNAYTHASTVDHAPANAEQNVIVGIRRNGVDLPVSRDSRKVDIIVPTTAADINADAAGSATNALSEAKNYTNTEVSKVQTALDQHAELVHFSADERTKLAGIESNAQKNTITGIKGNAESTYRTGNVNLTPANIGAAPSSHNHNDLYYTETEIDTKLSDINTAINNKSDSNHTHDSLYDTKGSAGAALEEANNYTDTKTTGMATTSSVTSKISTHNSSDASHSDIRNLISQLTTRLNTLANSDDTTLDQMAEIVEYIKANRDLIDSVTTDKVNVNDIVNNLTTNVANKPLSAAQGVAIKALIDELDEAIDGKASATHSHAISEVTNLQSTLNQKAAKADFDQHLDDTTAHITSDERTKWTNHANSAHAPSGAQANVIESIKVNGTAQTITNKSVDITVPTKASDIGAAASSHGTHVTWSTTSPKANGTAAVGSETNVARGDHVHPTDTTRASKTDLDSLAETVSGKADSTHGHAISDVTNLQSTLNGKVSQADFDVLESVVNGKADNEHTHNYAGSSSVGGAATSANKVNKSLTVKLNSGTTEGTDMFTFNGSAAKSVNITPSAIGAAVSSHEHDDKYYTETEIDVMITDINTAISGKAPTSHTHSISNVTSLQTELDKKVNNTTTINGKALSSNITLSASDVGAAPTHNHDSYVNQNAFSTIYTSDFGYANAANTESSLGIIQGNGISITTTTGKDNDVDITIDCKDATTNQKGIVQLTNSTSSTSTTTAATPSSVKSAYDLANTAKTTADKAKTAADAAEENAKSYTDQKVAALINGAPTTLDTLDEIAAALKDNASIVDVLNEAIGSKADSGHSHTITASASDDDVVVLTGTNGTNKVTYSASHANSGVTAGTYRSVTVNAKGHVTAGTNPTTISGYGITDAYTKTQIDAMELITVADIDAICGTTIYLASEVEF